MTASARAVTVLMDSDLLTLSRACAVLRRRNMPIRALSVDSQGAPGVWRLRCEIDVDDATARNLELLIENVVGVRQAKIAMVGAQHAAPLQSHRHSQESL